MDRMIMVDYPGLSIGYPVLSIFNRLEYEIWQPGHA